MGTNAVYEDVQLKTEMDTESHISIIRNGDGEVDDVKHHHQLSKTPPEFFPGEKVLAFHTEHLYQAKVMDTDFEKNKWEYWIHYIGWKSSWDEWVGVDRLMKFTKENIKMSEKIYVEPGASKNRKVALQSQPRNSSERGRGQGRCRGKKRGSGVDIETEIKDWEKAMKIRVPLSLRNQLADDCAFVGQNGEAINLPCSPHVEEILNMYIDHRLKNGEEVVDSLIEFVKGVRCYFDKALPALLLYKCECEQYRQFTANHEPPSKVYGAEHLLRLCVKLPELLYPASLEEAALREMQEKLQDLLIFMEAKQSIFFRSTTSFFKTITMDQ